MDALKLTDDERQQIGDIREQGFSLNFSLIETFVASSSFIRSNASADPFNLPFPLLIQAIFVSGFIVGGTVYRVIRPETLRVQLTEQGSAIGSLGFDRPSQFGTLAASWIDSDVLSINGIDSGMDLSILGLITRQFGINVIAQEEVSIGETCAIHITIRLKRAS